MNIIRSRGIANNMGRGFMGAGLGMMAGNAMGGTDSYMGTMAGIGGAVGSIFPGLGTLIGTGVGMGVGYLMDISKNTGETSEELKKRRMQEEEELRRKRAEEAARDMNRLDFLAGYIRSRGGSFMTDPEMLKAMQQFVTEQIKTRNALDRSRRTTGTGRTGP